MADLSGALRAAAEEAEKQQIENNGRFINLEQWVGHLENENDQLKSKLKTAAGLAKQFADLFLDD